MRALARRASWNLVDQVLSSATNAALSFLVARSVSATAFGGFSVAFTVFALLVGAGRALTTAPLGIRYSNVEDADFDGAAGRAAGAALVLGVVAGVAAIGVGLVLGADAGRALVALGVVLPALLVQDAWRYVFFARGRPAAAAANDAVWALLQLGAVAALLVVGVSTAGPLILAWGLSALGAALLGLHQARTFPRPRAARVWVREHLDLTRYLVAEFATLQGAQQGALLVIAAIATVQTVGALRGVQVLLGPTTILAVAAFSFAIPEFSRRDTDPARTRVLGAGALSGTVAVLGAMWGLLFLLLPDAVGAFLLGDTWPGVEAVLVPTVIAQFGAALSVGPTAMLYAMGRARVTFGVHVVEAALTVSAGIGGALLAGAVGAAWGFAVAFWVVMPLLWWRLGLELRRTGREHLVAGTDDTVRPAKTSPSQDAAAEVDR